MPTGLQQTTRDLERRAREAIQKPVIERIKKSFNIKGDKQLAERFGQKTSSISNYRNGQRPLPLEFLTITVNDTDASYAFLLEGAVDKTLHIATRTM